MRIKKNFATFFVGILMTSLPFDSPTISALDNSWPDSIKKITFDNGSNTTLQEGETRSIYRLSFTPPLLVDFA